MTCDHHLNAGPLVCVLDAGHDWGCVFESTSGVAGCPKEEML